MTENDSGTAPSFINKKLTIHNKMILDGGALC